MTTLSIEQLSISEEALCKDNAFWSYSLRLWKSSELQNTLLELQNSQGYRINLLLYACWLASQRKPFRPNFDYILMHSQEWNQKVIEPMRNARMHLPASMKNSALKNTIQRAELQAEQIEHSILFDLSQTFQENDSSDSDLDILIDNLRFCSRHLGKNDSEIGENVLITLIHSCVPSYTLEQISQQLHKRTAS